MPIVNAVGLAARVVLFAFSFMSSPGGAVSLCRLLRLQARILLLAFSVFAGMVQVRLCGWSFPALKEETLLSPPVAAQVQEPTSRATHSWERGRGARTFNGALATFWKPD